MLVIFNVVTRPSNTRLVDSKIRFRNDVSLYCRLRLATKMLESTKICENSEPNSEQVFITLYKCIIKIDVMNDLCYKNDTFSQFLNRFKFLY